MNEGIHLDLDTWIVPGQIRKAGYHHMPIQIDGWMVRMWGMTTDHGMTRDQGFGVGRCE